MISMRPIGYVRSAYGEVREIPKGLGAKHEAEGALEIEEEFEPGLRDIEGFSHLYVIWAFDRSEGCNLEVTPPSDDRPHGVFATRAPWRPNPIGLTVVELVGREGRMLRVRGIDMLDGTPILDIKPYLSERPGGGTAAGMVSGGRGERKKSRGRGCETDCTPSAQSSTLDSRRHAETAAAPAPGHYRHHGRARSNEACPRSNLHAKRRHRR